MAINPATDTYGTIDAFRGALMAVQDVDINAINPADPKAVSAKALVVTSVGGGGIAAEVTIANGDDTAEGNTGDAAYADATGAAAGTLVSLLKGIFVKANSGDAVTIANGADIAEGATTATAYSDVTGAAAGTVVGLLKGFYVALKAFAAEATPAGTNVIGKVGIDQTTPGTTNLVALAANQSVNNAQINGVTPLMGNGVTGTGSQRVTIVSDNAPFSVTPATPTFVGGAFALNGASQTLFAAGAALNYIQIQNPVGNATVSINLAGAAATTSNGIVLQAGSSLALERGSVTAITIIGTNAQSVIAFSG